MKQIQLVVFTAILLFTFSCKKEKEATVITYPANGQFGMNVIDQTKTEYPAGYLSLCAHLPDATSLKVKISGLNWFYSSTQDWSSWSKSGWNNADNSREFTSLKTGDLDFQLRFEAGSSVITGYENNSTEPTWTKTITIK